MSPSIRWILVSAVLLGGGVPAIASPADGRSPDEALPARLGDADPRPALEKIVRREDERYFSPREFTGWWGHGSAAVRARAALAAGRIGDPAAVEGLVGCLKEGGAVARFAAFSLGVIGSAEAVSPLIAALETDDDLLEEEILDALGRIGGEEAHRTLLGHLTDANAPSSTRAAAAIGLSRRPAQGLVAPLFGALEDPEAEVRWRIAYALSRTTWKGDPSRLLALVEDEHPWCRLFALRALRGHREEEVLEAFTERAGDESWCVAVEAVRGLAADGRPEAVARLTELSGHDSHHIRVEVMKGLGSLDLDALGFPKDERILAKASIIVSLKDPVPQVVAAAMAAYGKVFRQYAMRRLPDYLSHEDSLVRSAAVEALSRTGRPEVFKLLKERLAEDPDLRVKEAVLRSVSQVDLPPARAILLSGLEIDDVALVTSAADFLGARGQNQALKPLQRAFDRCDGMELAEARAAIVNAVAAVGGEKEIDWLHGALTDPDPKVRLAARAAISSIPEKEGDPPRTLASLAQLARVVPAPETPLVEIPLLLAPPTTRRPRVEFKTGKGEFTLELFPLEAPLHVDGFLSRVDSGFFKGLRFHRVVPNWVVQGGDPRGDGWGSGGVLLRDQVSPRPYLRGSVGVPTSGKDTAGCQVFITHVPAPRLEGSYTQIGRVIRGMEVVDRIEIDDAIHSVRRTR